MKTKTLIFIMFILTSINISPLLAGDDKVKNAVNIVAGHIQGNGGDVVYCPRESGNPEVELLDLYEARARWKLELALGPDNLTPIEKVHYVLNRLDRIDHFRAEYYRKKADEFFENALFISGITLIDLPDSQFSYIPSNCEIRQIAIQKTPQFPGEMLYTISQDLWDLLDNNNKAGVILHEIVYGEAILLDHPDSINTRYFMGHIASSFMNNISREDYVGLFKLTNFLDSGLEIDGIRYNMENLILFNDGSVKSGSLYYPHDDYGLSSGSDHFGKKEYFDQDINGETFTFESDIEFFENGKIKKGILAIIDKYSNNKRYFEGYVSYKYNADTGCSIIFFERDGGMTYHKHFIEYDQSGKLKKLIYPDWNYKIELINPNNGSCYTARYNWAGYKDEAEEYIDFHENGMVKKMAVANKHWDGGILPVHGKTIQFTRLTITTFHDNGYVASDIIENDEMLHTNRGDIREFKAGTLLNFDREGKVIVE